MNQHSKHLSQALMQRGHKITKVGDEWSIYLPKISDESLLRFFENDLYDLMKDVSFRSALRNFSFGSPIQSASAQRALDNYLDKCRGFGAPQVTQKRYSNTFEWFISEILLREFGAKTAGFGIRLKDAHPSDEFDCLAILDNGLLFAECKTGRDPIEKEITKFVRRDAEVSATYSMLIMDRDYFFSKEKDQPNITARRAAKYGIRKMNMVEYRGTQLLEIHVGNRYFFVFSGMEKLTEKIRYVIKYANFFSEGQSNPPGFQKMPITFTK